MRVRVRVRVRAWESVDHTYLCADCLWWKRPIVCAPMIATVSRAEKPNSDSMNLTAIVPLKCSSGWYSCLSAL